MRRLVDIDDVIKVAENAFPQEDVRKIMWVLCHTPTAYDVEKVVEELEKLENSKARCRNPVEMGKYQAYKKAIDIVRKGGVE